jgi:hypothetical protein
VSTKTHRHSCMVGLASMFYSSLAVSFWSVPSLNFHGQMTESGLGNVSYKSTPLMFTEEAIEEISSYNVKVDRDVTSHFTFDTSQNESDETQIIQKKEPAFHFDNETFNESYSLVLRRRERLIEKLSGEDVYSPLVQNSAWNILGDNLHLIQDFYSHSTWVEQGNIDIVDFSSDKNSSLFSNTAEELRATHSCELNLPNKPIPGQPLTTGYYEEVRENLPKPHEQKCHHGELITKAKECRLDDAVALTALGYGAHPSLGLFVHSLTTGAVLYESAIGGVGINKDDPLCNDVGRIAQKLATKETTTFVQSIIDELGEAGNIDGICALMGIEKEDCPKEEDQPPPTEEDAPLLNGSCDPAGCGELFPSHQTHLSWTGTKEWFRSDKLFLGKRLKVCELPSLPTHPLESCERNLWIREATPSLPEGTYDPPTGEITQNFHITPVHRIETNESPVSVSMNYDCDIFGGPYPSDENKKHRVVWELFLERRQYDYSTEKYEPVEKGEIVELAYDCIYQKAEANWEAFSDGPLQIAKLDYDDQVVIWSGFVETKPIYMDVFWYGTEEDDLKYTVIWNKSPGEITLPSYTFNLSGGGHRRKALITTIGCDIAKDDFFPSGRTYSGQITLSDGPQSATPVPFSYQCLYRNWE